MRVTCEDKLKEVCTSNGDGDIWEKYLKERKHDDSDFVCADIIYSDIIELKFFDVWTENYSYTMKRIEVSNDDIFHLVMYTIASLERNPSVAN